jgi:hypothetical protein
MICRKADPIRPVAGTTMRRLLVIAAIVAMTASLLALPMFNSLAQSATIVSVIVELRDDPGAVYAAKAKQQGTTVSADQMRAYRDQLRVKQDQFLTALSSNGIMLQTTASITFMRRRCMATTRN